MRPGIPNALTTFLSTFAFAVTAFADGMTRVEHVCIIDEDCIDNGALAIEELAQAGLCGGGSPAVCVNDQFANPGVRLLLPLAPGTIIGNDWPGGTDAPLFTGQLFDEGWFELAAEDAPESWTLAGPTADPLLNYLVATAPGFGNNGEFLLDEIPNVTPLRTAELQALVGHTCCAIVYDSDISINYDPLQGNLQGATLGVLRLTVLAVGEDPPGSVLPDITIRVEEDGETCFAKPVSVEENSWGTIKAGYR